MPRHPHLDPSPFFLEGGPLGVLLIHGFTGSPPEMRLVGDYLHRRGFTVSGPLLPGHGTTVEDMNRCQWTDWTGHAERALTSLQDRCEMVFVGGLSMGSLLTLYLAAHHPELPGVITYSPAAWPADRLIHLTPVLKHLIRKKPKSGDSDLTDPEADLRLWSYEENPAFAAHELLKLIRQVRRLLPQVRCPLLVIHGTFDQAIHPTSAQRTYERAGSTDKELVTLRNSGHCVTVDSEWEFVAEKTYQFIQALPTLRRHPLLSGKTVALVGVSTVTYDDAAYYFEIGKPKYWQRQSEGEDDITVVGVGGIGGSIARGETVLACLRREVEEELGVRIQFEMSHPTYLIHDWQIADELHLTPNKKRPTPLMVILVPPRLGGPDTPDHLAIASFRTHLRGVPAPHDLFGLLRVENRALAGFFARDEWPLDEAQALSGLTIVLNGQLPPRPVLRPVLTARAFQLLVRVGYV